MTTYGLTVVTSGETVGNEPISVSEFKAYMNITFDAHDTKITRLISACREALEQFKSVTLIQQRSVSVSWQTFSFDEVLPFLPIKTPYDVTVTDLEGNVISSGEYKLVGTGGFLTFVGEFPNGVQLSYDTAALSIDNRIKELLIRAVALCFETDMNPEKAVQKIFDYVKIY